MKLPAAGRILLWNGGSLWIGRAGAATEFHSHHAVQIGLAHPGEALRFRRPQEAWRSFHAALIPAHQPHAFDGCGKLVATLFVEPESRSGQALQQHGGTDIREVSERADGAQTTALFAAYAANAPDAALIDAARALVAHIAQTLDGPRSTLDPRIVKAMALVRARIDEQVPLAAVAAAVHLSPERFRHLFIEQTGIRFRAYVLWLRIELALAAYAAHRSLTEAAQSGGFADSAHFTRTFKTVFGLAPSSIHID